MNLISTQQMPLRFDFGWLSSDWGIEASIIE